jgi:adenylate cyclase
MLAAAPADRHHGQAGQVVRIRDSPNPAYHAAMVGGEQPKSDPWRALLTGEDRGLQRLRRFWRHVPSPPRCKVCAAPFHGPGGVVARALRFGPSPDNALLCRACFGTLVKNRGGAELEISVLFADVRGSTALAERVSAAEFRALLQDYYRLAAMSVDRNGGIVDKFLGDGVMSLFIPVISGENHAGRAIDAGRAILAAVNALAGRGLLVGAGVHAGDAFVGSIGSDVKVDFTALGDTVNVAARLGALAGPGELLVSRFAWDRAGLGEPPREREVEIAGRTATLPVVSLAAPGSAGS